MREGKSEGEDVALDSGIAELVLYEDEDDDISAIALLQENYLHIIILSIIVLNVLGRMRG